MSSRDHRALQGLYGGSLSLAFAATLTTACSLADRLVALVGGEEGDTEGGSGEVEALRSEGETPRFVVLPVGTRLSILPSEDAPSLQFNVQDRLGVAVARQQRAFRVSEQQGDWLRVRNLGDEAAARHCAQGWKALQGLELDFWVPLSAALVVTQRTVVSKFADGTSVMLSAGVPVTAVGGAAATTEADQADDAKPYIAGRLGAGATVSIPYSAVGQFYVPGSLYNPGEAQLAFREPVSLTVAGAAVSLADLRRDGSLLAVFGKSGDDSDRTYQVGNRCTELRVRASAEPQAAKIIAPTKPAAVATPPSYEVPPNVAVSWKDGTVVGRTAEVFALVEEPTLHGEQMCFRIRAVDEPLCFAGIQLKALGEPKSPTDPTSEVEPEAEPEAKPEAEPEAKPEAEPEAKPEAEPEAKPAPVVPGTPAKLKLGRAFVRGSLERPAVAKVISAKRSAARRCYDKAKSTEMGTIVVSFTIKPDGKVGPTKVLRGDFSDKAVGACLVALVRRLTFPAPLGGGLVVVRQPFVFEKK